MKGVNINPEFGELSPGRNKSLDDPTTIIGHVQKLKEFPTGELGKVLKSLEIKPSDKIEPPKVAWKQITETHDIILGTLGNFSLIIGKAKSRKSFFISIAVSATLSQSILLNQFRGVLPHDKRTVLYFDTEQGKYHVQLVLKRICDQINEPEPKNLKVYGLRSISPEQRLSVIEYAIENTDNLGFVVIDGVKDLITSINDEEQASMIATKLLKWTEEREIHIVTVLHQNKSDNNARGHIGTELINKAETTLSVTKNEQDKDVSIVKAEYCRNKEPEPFAFEIIDGLPSIVENFELRTETRKNKFEITDLPDHQIFELLNIVYSNGDSFMYAELVRQLKIAFKDKFQKTIGDNRIKDLISYCNNKGWVNQSKKRAPYNQGQFDPGNKMF